MGKTQNSFEVIGVVGLGLIGGSIGLDLQALGLEVRGLTHRKKTAVRAKARGLVNTVSTSPEILKTCELIILALPLKELINPNEELIQALPKNAVITDVGSVKAPVLKAWKHLHPRFVASHPMAGTTEEGVEAGIKDLFRQRPWVSTPDSDTDQDALETVHQLATKLGSKWIATDAVSHDQAVALISHLPVLISASLLHAVEHQSNKDLQSLFKQLASSGFADITRIGGGNPRLGTDMSSNNTNSILNGLNLYKSSIKHFEEILIGKDWQKLEEELKRTKEIRESFF